MPVLFLNLDGSDTNNLKNVKLNPNGTSNVSLFSSIKIKKTTKQTIFNSKLTNRELSDNQYQFNLIVDN